MKSVNKKPLFIIATDNKSKEQIKEEIKQAMLKFKKSIGSKNTK